MADRAVAHAPASGARASPRRSPRLAASVRHGAYGGDSPRAVSGQLPLLGTQAAVPLTLPAQRGGSGRNRVMGQRGGGGPVGASPVAYALRVDCPSPDVIRSVLAWLEVRGGAFAVVLEGVSDNNPHLHAVLWDAARVEALRLSFKRAVPDATGNGAYSLTVVTDLDKYERYLAKGLSVDEGPEVVATYGVQYDGSQFWFDRHAAYWDEHDRLAVARSARASGPLLDEALALARERGIRWEQEDKLARLLIDLYAQRRKTINTFHMRGMVNLMMVELCPSDEARDRLALAVAARM